jgi:hypothetical protein
VQTLAFVVAFGVLAIGWAGLIVWVVLIVFRERRERRERRRPRTIIISGDSGTP